MGQLDNVHLRVTALGQRPVLVRMSKKDPRLALETKDALSDFLAAIVEYVGEGKVLDFGAGPDHQYELTLKRKEKT